MWSLDVVFQTNFHFSCPMFEEFSELVLITMAVTFAIVVIFIRVSIMMLVNWIQGSPSPNKSGADNRNPKTWLFWWWYLKGGVILKHWVRRVHMTQVAAVVDSSHLPALRYWISGFTLQTLVYGINTVIFLTLLWVLILHILKGVPSNRFHRHHRFQNCIFLVYMTGMFALSSVYMAYQGLMIDVMWFRYLSTPDTPKDIFEDSIPILRTCNAIFILVNWGTVSLFVSSYMNETSSGHLILKWFSYGVVCFITRSAQCFPVRSWVFPICCLHLTLVRSENLCGYQKLTTFL